VPEHQREMLSLVTARVRDAFVRKPYYLDGATDLVSACRELAAHGLTSALVKDGERLGIFTTTDLRDALLRDEPPARLQVKAVARFDIIDVDANTELFEALWLMVRHRVHRLVVREGEHVVGLLGQLDLVSFVANHSLIVAIQIDEAASIDELEVAAQRIDQMVTLLHGSGIRIERVARLVGELSLRLKARLWALLAPAELVANSCLLVMGSEGRGEQILKTDQDNALVLRDGFAFAGLAEVTARFSEALARFGYPPCPGNIMVTNPLWCQSETGFREAIRGWLMGDDPEGPMRLAIFCDAAPAAGDAALLHGLRDYLTSLFADHDAWLARFAAAADQFQEPGRWWARLTSRRDEQPLDLKKLGIFPIVHGVRSLALQYRVHELGTGARLARLVAGGHIDAQVARDLQDSLHFLMATRLAHQLEQRSAGATPTNEVRPSQLALLEREPLRDSLAVVKRFRAWLRQHFRFDSL